LESQSKNGFGWKDAGKLSVDLRGELAYFPLGSAALTVAQKIKKR
jgi:hypothetical protein